MPRLRTVRSKLLLLVGLSVVVTFVMLPFLFWLLHEQLRGEVDHGLTNAQHAYQAELDDGITDSQLASTLLASDATVRRAMQSRDTRALQSIANTFGNLYPDMDISFVDRDDVRLARVGCDEDGPPLADHTLVNRALAGEEVFELSPLGCDRTPMPTYLILRRAGDLGVVIVGLDFSQASLAHAASKLHLELALLDPTGKIVSQTAKFPSEGNRAAFITKPFAPKQLQARGGDFSLLAAIDVTQLRAVVQRNLFVAMGVVSLVALVSVAFGIRLANAMSKALKRVSDGVKKLDADEYVKIEGIRPGGDELEALATAFNTMVDGLQERDKLRTTFGKYMTTSVMDHLLAGDVQLGGVAITATILFTDIRSFTSISEHMEARTLVALLNEYFTEMVDVVIKEDGVVDKYIGDAIMVVFGPPLPKQDDALRAVRAAVGMRQALAHLNESLVKRGMRPIATGIGIHTGEVIAGNIGSERRMEYTVIGDAVNVASRLETATKEHGVPVLISSETYALVKDSVDARLVGSVPAKGHGSVVAYSLLGLKPS